MAKRIQKWQIGGSPNDELMGFPVQDDTYTTLSWDDGTQVLTLTPVGAKFSVWVQGEQFTFTAPRTKDISGVIAEGIWYFYFDASGVLQGTQVAFDFSSQTPVAIVRWDNTNTKAILLADERHGLTMSWATHAYLHNTVRTRYESGLGLSGNIAGDGSVDSHAQVDISAGIVADEDLVIAITDGAGPGRFIQDLSPAANIPIFYLNGGPATPVWRRVNSTAFPVFADGANRVKYNLNTAGTWTQPNVTANGQHVAMWIFAGNTRAVPSDGVTWEEPVIAILGQRTDVTLGDAQQNNTLESIVLPEELSLESKPIYRLIFQTSTIYANTPHARLRDILDLRSVSTVPGTFVPTVHNSLAGLNTYPAHPTSALSTLVQNKAVDYPMVAGDFGTVIRFTGAGLQTFTLFSTLGEDIGKWVQVIKGGVGNVSISVPAGYTMYLGGVLYTGPTTVALTTLRRSVILRAISATEWDVVDDGSNLFNRHVHIDNAGAVIGTGLQTVKVEVPVDGVITAVQALSFDTGAIVVDIWKCTYAAYDAGATHPVNGDSIVAAAPVTLAAAYKSEDTTLAGWTLPVLAGDLLFFNVDSCAGISDLTIVLKFTAT